MSVFGNKDLGGDVVLPGAFTKSLKARQQPLVMLWQHNSDFPIGTFPVTTEDSKGLYVEGKFVPQAEKAEGARALLKAGAISGMSIGHSIPKGGGTFNEKDNVFVINRADLWEGSIVTFPMNPAATVDEVKSLIERGQRPTVRQFESFLRDAGFSRKEATAIVADGYRNQGDPDGVADELQSLINKIKG